MVKAPNKREKEIVCLNLDLLNKNIKLKLE